MKFQRKFKIFHKIIPKFNISFDITEISRFPIKFQRRWVKFQHLSTFHDFNEILIISMNNVSKMSIRFHQITNHIILPEILPLHSIIVRLRIIYIIYMQRLIVRKFYPTTPTQQEKTSHLRSKQFLQMILFFYLFVWIACILFWFFRIFFTEKRHNFGPILFSFFGCVVPIFGDRVLIFLSFFFLSISFFRDFSL